MPTKIHPRPQYDLSTAVTFMLAGLALGSVLTVLFSPLTDGSVLRFPWFGPRSNIRSRGTATGAESHVI